MPLSSLPVEVQLGSNFDAATASLSLFRARSAGATSSYSASSDRISPSRILSGRWRSAAFSRSRIATAGVPFCSRSASKRTRFSCASWISAERAYNAPQPIGQHIECFDNVMPTIRRNLIPLRRCNQSSDSPWRSGFRQGRRRKGNPRSSAVGRFVRPSRCRASG